MAKVLLQERVQNYLRDNGIKHKFFAERVGLSQPVLSMWLRNKVSLSYSTIEKIMSIVDNN